MPWKTGVRAMVLELARSDPNLPISAIAARLGISRQRVHILLRELGLSVARTSHISPATRPAVVAALPSSPAQKPLDTQPPTPLGRLHAAARKQQTSDRT